MNYPLFETLCLYRYQVRNLSWHQRRYEESLARFYGENAYGRFDLNQILQKNTALFQSIQSDLIRCRIDYNADSYHIRAFPYSPKVYRRFQPVICDDIDYALKFTDRRQLDSLLAQKGNGDEIMIVRQGFITDCSIGNLIFRQGSHWFTPDTPLLKGTQRQALLQQGKIQERTIRLGDLAKFDEVRLINALNGF